VAESDLQMGILGNAGAISHALMEKTVRKVYDEFVVKRDIFDAQVADEEDILELQNAVKSRGKH
jgi:hypothetical protein